MKDKDCGGVGRQIGVGRKEGGRLWWSEEEA
jgi:hypothetical protein